MKRDEEGIEIYDPRSDMSNFEVLRNEGPQDDLEDIGEDD